MSNEHEGQHVEQELARRKPIPTRQDDPRDRTPAPGPGPERGSIPGVGWKPPTGRGANGEVLVNLDAHPIEGEVFGPGVPVTDLGAMEERWPGYRRGFDMHSEAKTILDGLWAARLIPGLAHDDHAKYTGIATWEEYYDLRALAGSRGSGPSPDVRPLLNAWNKLNGLGPGSDTKPPAVAPQAPTPAGPASIDSVVSLTNHLAARVDRLEGALGLNLEGINLPENAPGGGTWTDMLNTAATALRALGPVLDGNDNPDVLDLLPIVAALLPLLRGLRRKDGGR